MGQSEVWLGYFKKNRDRRSPELGPLDGLDPRLRAALVRSLGRFYLGESSEGRIAQEAARSRDPALDDATRESIALYIREEGRHARELSTVLRALGASLPRHHWTESLFRRGRRLLGLRTKMMTIGAAEVVGVVYYGLLAERVPALAEVAGTIGRDEQRHLDFQAEFFARAFGRPGAEGVLLGSLGAAGFLGILTCAVTAFLVDHAALLSALGISRGEVVERCSVVARRSFVSCLEKREAELLARTVLAELAR